MHPYSTVPHSHQPTHQSSPPSLFVITIIQSPVLPINHKPIIRSRQSNLLRPPRIIIQLRILFLDSAPAGPRLEPDLPTIPLARNAHTLIMRPGLFELLYDLWSEGVVVPNPNCRQLTVDFTFPFRSCFVGVGLRLGFAVCRLTGSTAEGWEVVH
jgi:hypothetical protein